MKQKPIKIRATKKRKTSNKKAELESPPVAIVEQDIQTESSQSIVTQKAQDSESVFDLVSMLVHDLESPLASMNYTLELMESGRFDNSNPLHQRMLEGAQVAIKRAETIVADMLTTAKSEETDLAVNWQTINLFSIAENAVQMASPSAGQNGIAVELDQSSADCKHATLQADEHLLTRIVDNLIFNAIRHTPPKGTITVSITCDDQHVSMTVTDTGVGIQGIEPSKLFEKFGQIEYRKQKKHRGVGLGLFFCRIAAEAMNAELFARNAPEGGAQFGITFSVASANTDNS